MMEVNENGLVVNSSSVLNNEPHKLARAIFVDNEIRRHSISLYVNLSVMMDERLFEQLGFETAKDYITDLSQTLSITTRQIYVLASIGREFKPYALLPDGTVSENAERAAVLGQKKLSLIAKHAKEEVAKLIEQGKIEIGDEELTLDDLKKKSVKALRDEMKEMSSKAQRTDELDAKLKLKEKENEDLLKELKELRPLKEQLTSRREIKTGLSAAGEHIAAAARIFASINISALDEDLQKEVAMSLNMTYDVLLSYRDKNIEIFDLLDNRYLTL
jgi:uncharacterized protein YmfQ (DUF2313 family)